MNIKKLKMFFNMMLHPGGFTCRDSERLLFDFVEGLLDADQQEKLEKHLSDCPECLEFVRTYRKAITLTRTHGTSPCPEIEIPHQLLDKLHEFITSNPDVK